MAIMVGCMQYVGRLHKLDNLPGAPGPQGGMKMGKSTVVTQCRSCGGWFVEGEMFDTDYRTYVQKGDPDEMVCERCYDNYYAKCRKCGAIRLEVAHLKNGACDPDIFEDCTED